MPNPSEFKMERNKEVCGFYIHDMMSFEEIAKHPRFDDKTADEIKKMYLEGRDAYIDDRCSERASGSKRVSWEKPNKPSE